jgi:hypothetical protein
MDARCLWVPGKIDLAQSSEGWQLCLLASSHGQEHCQILSRHCRNTMIYETTTQPFEVENVAFLPGKKKREIFTSIYEVSETTFSDQTGQFPTISQHGNKYVPFYWNP